MRNLSEKLILTFLLSVVVFNLTAHAQKAELVVQTGHTYFVSSVAFSPDNKILASGSEDTTIKFWDVQTGQELRTLIGHKGSVSSVVFLPDGKTLASGGDDNTIKLWDVATGQELKTLSGHTDYISSVVCSADGRTLASGSGDKTIKLWDVTTGKELKTLKGHSNSVYTVAFSPDGKMLASGGWDSTVKLWDIKSGQEIKTLYGHTRYMESVAFSPDGKTLISSSSSSDDKTVKLWDVATGQELKTLKDFDSVTLSPDGKILAGSINETIKLLDMMTGQELRTFKGHSYLVTEVEFSPDGKTLASVSREDHIIKLWDVQTGKELKTFSGHTSHINSVVFSRDNNTVISGNYNDTIKVWNVTDGQELKTFADHSEFVYSLTISPNGKTLASKDFKRNFKLWDVATGKALINIASTVSSYGGMLFAFSPDGKILALQGKDGITLWDVQTGKELRTLIGQEYISSIMFSPDGKTLVSGGFDTTIKVWDVQTGKKLNTLVGHSDFVQSLAFSPDGKTLASGSQDKTIKLWDVASGKALNTLYGHNDEVESVSFSPDGKTLASGSDDKTVKLWNIATGQELKSFEYDNPNTAREVFAIAPGFFQKRYGERGKEPGEFSYFYNIRNSQPITADGKFQIKVSENGKLDLFEFKSGKLLASLVALDENDWAVVTPEGLFDASPDARKLMHYVVGFEPISLDQMKEVYYVPGLLQKIFRGDPLPQVELFSKQDLFPSVEYEPLKPNQKQLTVKLTNRGGGIGQVQILVNGKELISDARPAGFNPNLPQAVLTVDLSKAAIKTGEENSIEIIARNTAGSLNSRGTRGPKIIYLDDGRKQTETPNIYAIIVGISNYTGDNLKLNFAAKDAEDFARALELGATKFVGDKNKVHIRLLTSNGDKSTVKFNSPDSRISTATKADFERAFADFKNATPNDVFIVYLSGHGVSLNLNQNPNQAGGDTYLYLTQEATTTDKSVLAIENSRKAMTISSEELKELMKQNKALKQVLILDTCAAGALSNSLALKKDLPPDQIRAIERLKDNTGFFVLMGSAADAVSYEASQYGQGLLTYSLLQGMKGAKLRDNQFADVGLLFGYAQDAVPQMAKNIGGVQRPLIITPDTSNSFDIGQFTVEEQRQIVLSNPKPLVLRPHLQNKEQDYDDLELTALLRRELREANFATTRGGNSASLILVDADEMVDAIKPSGSYTVEGDEIKITIRLVRNKTPINSLTISGKVGDKERLVKQLVAEMIKSAK
ncbi:MAG: caspase family protein [Blastocatellia bacterium]